MKNKEKILIIDDEKDIRELLYISISRMGYDCVSASGFNEGIELLKNSDFRLCLTDMNLGDGNGLDIIKYIQQNKPDTIVAMITAYGNTETAIEAMKAGAFDFIQKPIQQDHLTQLIKFAITTPAKLQHSAPSQEGQVSLLGDSDAMIKLREKIQKVSRSMAPVFINGESGSGKELVARLIHQNSSRADFPFIAVNCGAIPTELMESEFFGHEKGSFTGATEKKEGLFKAAEGGTLFLDEVADLPKSMQVKLLRALQEKSIRPLGANEETPVNIRILSATHKNLANEVSQGSFRQDLFYRINVIEITVPNLRSRQDDIMQLADFFLQKLSERYEMPQPSLSQNALNKLKSYHFPGNVRELENTLERAFTLCELNTIEADDLSLGNQTTNTEESSISNQDIESSSQQTTAKPELQDDDAIHIEDAIGDLEGFLVSIEKQALELALEKTRWNKTAAAELLGISFRTMRYKLKKLDIQ